MPSDFTTDINGAHRHHVVATSSPASNDEVREAFSNPLHLLLLHPLLGDLGGGKVDDWTGFTQLQPNPFYFKLQVEFYGLLSFFPQSRG